MTTVIADTQRSLVSIATSSSYLRSGLSAYIAGYDPTKYSGALAARPIDADSGAIQSTETWNAATLLDALTSTQLSNRFIATYNGSNGISWGSYSTLPTAIQTKLNQNSSGTADSLGSQRFDFIRGVRSNEQANGGTLRDRGSRLGDIVNSNIWYTGKPASGYNFNNYSVFRGTSSSGKGNRTTMLYVGANDGMLHGFDASTGAEKLAYIPYGVATGNLRALTDTGYSHQYYVDGSPFTGDAYLSDGTNSNWKTILVGSLGAGGKGYFVLDVTDPANFTTSNVGSLVITDTTATSDADIGYITSPPVTDSVNANLTQQIVRLNNGRWAVILGNGVNSSNEAPVLLIQYLDGDKSVKKLSPCTQPIATNTCSFKSSNGLSSPLPVDLNGDGVVDAVYAGDIQGNMWKFNLGSIDAANWSTAFSNQPLFVAKRSNVAQPITTAPFWAPHPNGGVMLAFGTGQNLTDNDRTNTAVQSYFGIWDNSIFATNPKRTDGTNGGITITDASTTINTTSSPALTKLQQQTINSTPVADTGGTNYYNSTSNIFTYGTGTGQKMGWYLDWPLSGQRVLTNTRTFAGQKILIQTTIPKAGDVSTTETCSGSPVAEKSYQSVLNLFYGTRPDQPPFIYLNSQGNNVVSDSTMVETGAGDTALLRTDGNPKLLSSNCPAGSTCTSKTFISGKSVGLRASWRQILQ
nr:PilC/PilY family type IV pilus protein [Curvibacter sp. CHRR-16]